MTPDEQLEDDILHHSLELFRLIASKSTAVMKRIKTMEKRLIGELAAGELSSARKRQINKLLQSSDDIITETYDSFPDEIEAPEIARTVATVTGRSLTVALGVEAIKLPSEDYFASVASDILIKTAPSAGGANVAAWFEKQAQDTAFKFTAQVRQGLANSETNQQIIARIVGKRGIPGVLEIPRRNAAVLVQTSVQAIANDARMTTFEKNNDVIKGYRQVSTLDSHTSLICIAYSGATWNKDFEGLLPYDGGCPRHWNCRSLIVPVTKTFRELGINIDEPKPTTRASDEGQISAQTTFDEFLKRKGKAYQDEMLGEGRADLWRGGKLTLRDLVDGKGRPLTLKELRARYE